MSKLAKMKARLTPISYAIQAQVGDAFNMDALAQLFVKIEEQNEITPQLAQVLDYAKFIPVTNVNAVYGGGEILSRKKAWVLVKTMLVPVMIFHLQKLNTTP